MSAAANSVSLPRVAQILRISTEAAESRLAGSKVNYMVGADGVKRIGIGQVPQAMGITQRQWRAAVVAAVSRPSGGAVRG